MTVQPAICAQLQFHRVHIFLQPVLHFFAQPSHFCAHGCLGAIWLGPNMSPLAPCYPQAPTQLWQACQKHCHQALHWHWTIHLRRRTADLDKTIWGRRTTELDHTMQIRDGHADIFGDVHRCGYQKYPTYVRYSAIMAPHFSDRTQSQLVWSFESQGVSKILRACRNFGKVNG